jgi:hypothetical protein
VGLLCVISSSNLSDWHRRKLNGRDCGKRECSKSGTEKNCFQMSKITLHRIGEKKTQRRMGRYDGFTLKRRYEIVVLTKHRDHTRARVCSWRLSSNAKRLVPSLSHRGILSSQGYTPMKDEHPFNCTPVQLHTHKDTHSFSYTPVAKVQHWSCQNVTRLTTLTVNLNWKKFFFRITGVYKRIQIGMFRPIRMDHTNCLQVAIKTHSFI